LPLRFYLEKVKKWITSLIYPFLINSRLVVSSLVYLCYVSVGEKRILIALDEDCNTFQDKFYN
jgi:hypothetical protein